MCDSRYERCVDDNVVLKTVKADGWKKTVMRDVIKRLLSLRCAAVEEEKVRV